MPRDPRQSQNFRVMHDAIGPSFNMYRKGDVVSRDMLKHSQQGAGDAKEVPWDIDRLLALGAIAATDDDVSVSGPLVFAPAPDTGQATRGERVPQGVHPAEGEPENAPPQTADNAGDPRNTVRAVGADGERAQDARDAENERRQHAGRR